MVLPNTKKRIEEIEKQITRDFSDACETAYTLPLVFSAPKRIGAGSYRVSADVIEASGKYYPTGVFAGNVVDAFGGKVLVLSFDYESLGKLYGKGDGEYLFGIKTTRTDAKDIKDLTEKMYFDIDTRNSSYSLPENVTEEKQKI